MFRKTRKHDPILDRMMIKLTMMMMMMMMMIIMQTLFESPLNISKTSREGLRIMIVITVTFKCRLCVSIESAHSCFILLKFSIFFVQCIYCFSINIIVIKSYNAPTVTTDTTNDNYLILTVIFCRKLPTLGLYLLHKICSVLAVFRYPSSLLSTMLQDLHYTYSRRKTQK
jgi:hypothetical protein